MLGKIHFRMIENIAKYGSDYGIVTLDEILLFHYAHGHLHSRDTAKDITNLYDREVLTILDNMILTPN